MKSAVVARPFTRSDTREYVRTGQVIEAAAAYINELAGLGLVRQAAMAPSPREVKADPFADAGERSSVSPAAQALPQTTAVPRKPGRPPKPPAA